jgi:hypothetical protein
MRNEVVNVADFNKLSEAEKTHFYQCKQCGQMVDMRQLDDVLFHIRLAGLLQQWRRPALRR